MPLLPLQWDKKGTHKRYFMSFAYKREIQVRITTDEIFIVLKAGYYFEIACERSMNIQKYHARVCVVNFHEKPISEIIIMEMEYNLWRFVM
jgi:hypothetical protein